jgi:hypothetical protein
MNRTSPTGYITNYMVTEPKGSSPFSQEPTTGRILTLVNLLHTLPANLLKIHFDPTYASVFQVVSFLPAFPPKLCTLLSSPMCATCPTHLILLDLICLMIGDKYKLQSSLLCNFLHSPIYFTSLRSKYSSQYLVLTHPQPMLFP